MDSVKCCINGSMFGKDWHPDLVLSGINKGCNTGIRVLSLVIVFILVIITRPVEMVSHKIVVETDFLYT